MNPRLGYVHVNKMSYRLVDAIVDAGLGGVAHDVDGEWLGVHAEPAASTCARSRRRSRRRSTCTPSRIRCCPTRPRRGGRTAGPPRCCSLTTHVVEAPRRRRDGVIRESPVGCLFHVGEEWSTDVLVDRVSRAMT